MKGNITISVNKEDVTKVSKTARRSEMITAGVYNLHKNKTFKDKSNYQRKEKHKVSYF